ncbi:hypothetical protein [Nocardia sp. NBC_00416]|uniref:hypothetical protein n=1 Tax=Nocardia sp. NBC_00416 TaxID=2975991 RepID=UPI002E1E3E74
MNNLLYRIVGVAAVAIGMGTLAVAGAGAAQAEPYLIYHKVTPKQGSVTNEVWGYSTLDACKIREQQISQEIINSIGSGWGGSAGACLEVGENKTGDPAGNLPGYYVTKIVWPV